MSDKQHIDKLFQDKLKDFEATPSTSAWENISSELAGPQEERKGIPLWIKIAGVAAGLILLIALGNGIFNSGSDASTPDGVVDTEIDAPTETTPNNENDASENQLIADEEDEGLLNEQQNNLQQQDPANRSLQNQQINTPEQDGLAENESISEKPSRESQEKNLIKNKNNDEVVVQNDTDTKTDKLNQESSEVKKNKALTDANAEGEKTNLGKVANQDDDKLEDKDEPEKPVIQQKTDELIKGEKDELDSKVTDIDAKAEKDELEDPVKTEEDAQKSITEAVGEQEETEDALADADTEMKRWEIAPNVAPVYFNSFGKGSSIDEVFKNNDRKGEVNMNYGITASYSFNEKLSIRTGINQLKTGYSTNGVIVYNNVEASVEDKPLKNVNLNETGQNFSFLSSNGLSFAQVPGVVSQNIQSSIDQKLGFIEVPVELAYKLSDKKLDVSLIGGVSTLFLNENEIYSTLQGETTLLGEASNINKTSFSANLGVGLNLEVSEKINLNLEPVFKYQLNTFKDTSGDFNPYTFGVYTGFSIKF